MDLFMMPHYDWAGRRSCMNAHVIAFFKGIFLFTLMAFIAVPSVGAVAYDWSYMDPGLGGVLSGRIEGTPTAGDPTLVSVTGLSDLAFNSVSLGIPKLEFTFSLDDFLFPPGTGAEPIVSFDGTFMDLLAADAADIAAANHLVAFSFGNQAEAYGLAGILIGEPYNVGTTAPWSPDAWTMRTAPVPEPATILLIGSGIIALAGFRRKGTKA